MKRYVLVVCTFLVHSLVNNSKSPFFIKNSDDAIKDMVNVDVSVDDTLMKKVDDSTKYVKKPELHSATWYNMHGSLTASGIRFHKDSLTAAYNYSKLGTYLRVTNTNSNQSVIVKITDRMGYKGKHHIDLSKCAFDSIADPRSGRIKVMIEEVIK